MRGGLRFSSRSIGDQIQLTEDRLTARRSAGFCDAVVVSAQGIPPGQVLALEIVETESGWSGDLRVGFTMLPPAELFPLPSLVQRGDTWMCAVSRTLQTLTAAAATTTTNTAPPPSDEGAKTSPTMMDITPSSSVPVSSSVRCPCWLRTSYGAIPLSQLIPEIANSSPVAGGIPVATDKGSLIGVYYELEYSPYAHGLKVKFYLVVNGVQLGCWEQVKMSDTWNPGQRPLRAVVDVYGVTKAVRLVDIYQIVSLESLSEQAVLHCLRPPLLLPTSTSQVAATNDNDTETTACVTHSSSSLCSSSLCAYSRSETINRLPLPPVIRNKLQRKNQLVSSSSR